MKSLRRTLMIAVAAICLAGCGADTDDTGDTTGKVNLETKATTTTASEATTTAATSADEEPATTTAAEPSEPEDETSSTEKTTAKKKKPKEEETEQQTQAPADDPVDQPPAETQQPSVTPPAPQQEQVDPNSFYGRIRVRYNGFEFGVGDNMSAVEGYLGAQPAPASDVPSCIGSDIVKEYYFYGMTIQVHNDVIFSIDIMDNAYYGDQMAETTAGLSMYMTKGDMESIYGGASSPDEINYYYSEGPRTIQISVINDSVERIWINDKDLA